MWQRIGLLALVTALLGAAACASSPSAPRAAHSTEQLMAAISSPAPLTPAQRTQAWLSFAACLRTHGLNVPDPTFDQNGNPQWSVNPKAQPNAPTAIDACQSQLQVLSADKPTASAPTAADIAQLTQLSLCVRQHGFPNFPVPNAQTGEVSKDSMPDKTNPAFLAALQACQQFIPQKAKSGS
jgi:hypothetical protein